MEAKFDVPRFGTINECAKMTGLSKFHIRQLVLQNKVKYIRTGAKYLINISNLIVYLNIGDNPLINEPKSNNEVERKAGTYESN